MSKGYCRITELGADSKLWPLVVAELRRLAQSMHRQPTIADVSLTSYLYYPPEEFGFDIATQHKNIAAWLDRMKSLSGWAHPYELMPGHQLPQ